ncbi:hypothetical protein [Nonlabens xiamenensis]|uniref:hypothetical protein n=1 Tax=Nonlabens xiamenensis TaxID=2341043 RepID=UPI000F615E3F|nr:hypothetical protein [Nonlabens xiamenensis]
MSFINKYTYSKTVKFNLAKEFIEGTNAFVLAVGLYDNKSGIVNALKPNGEVIWEKIYTIPDSTVKLNFQNVVVAEFDNVVQYIIHASDSNNHFLLSINSTGDLLWQNQILGLQESQICRIDSSVYDKRPYLMISDDENNEFSNEITVSEIDSLGSIKNSISIFHSDSKLSAGALKVEKDEILVASSCTYGESNINPLIIELTRDLKEINNTQIFLNSICKSVTRTNEGNLIVSSLDATSSKFYLSSVQPGEENGIFKFYSSLDNNDSTLETYSSGFYLLHFLGENGSVRAFDDELIPIWSKRILASNVDNNLRSFCPDGRDNSIYTTPIDELGNSLVCRSDKDFENCKSTTVPIIDSDRTELSIETLNLGFRESEMILETVDISTSSINSTQSPVCSPNRENFELSENMSIQSPSFGIQAAGSIGADSSLGIHTRWVLTGSLGELHLPKGNMATGTSNFNQPNDFVKLYRARYTPSTFELNFADVAPSAVNDLLKFWIYRFGEKEFKIYFKDLDVYTAVRQSIDPMTDTLGFLEAYGTGLIEVHCSQLFFSAKLNSDSYPNGSYYRAEVHSAPHNGTNAQIVCSLRKDFSSDFSQMNLKAENGKLVKFTSLLKPVSSIIFEFYEDQFNHVNQGEGWTHLGDFSLTQDTDVAYRALEPFRDAVNSQWKRFNDEEFVNVDNYKKRFNNITDPQDRDLVEIISNYVSLSNDVNNPTAIEAVDFYDEEGNTTEISNLDVLNLASYDYHIARMLGLGYLDLDTEVFDGTYIYLAIYETNGDLQDGNGAKYVQHIAISLPTSIHDSRLPIPIDLNRLTPGIELDNVNITDENGYSHDGMSRYVQIFMDELPAYEYNQEFFHDSTPLELHNKTFPLYAGLEHRLSTTTEWDNPELAHDVRYSNVNSQGALSNFETRPLNIPESDQALYIHKQKKSGTHVYSSYGINIFSRATNSDVSKILATTIQQKNNLVPPTNLNAHIIKEEKPLMLTSLDEQQRLQMLLSDGGKTDKTLMRVRFDYNSNHELKTYQVPLNSPYTNSDYLNPLNTNNPDILFPDNEEIFADEVELFFRPKEPNRITGKISAINSVNGNDSLCRFTVDDYVIASQNTVETPLIIQGTANNFIGSVLMMGSERFIVQSLSIVNENAEFDRVNQITVYKQEISQSIFNNGAAATNGSTSSSPVIIGDGYFICIENMLNENSWEASNPSSFKVQIGDNWDTNGIHRELIQFTNSDGEIERHVEKSRGFWFNASVDRIDEEEYEVDQNSIITVFLGRYILTSNGFNLNHHPQFSSTNNSVEWHGGIVRIHVQGTNSNGFPTQTRKVLQVQKIITKDENGNPIPLQLICRDEQFVFNSSDNVAIEEGANVEVNFYPGYRAYYYQDDSILLNETNTIPLTENVKTAMIGLRSVDNDFNPILKSKISPPFLLQIPRQIEPKQPLLPIGSNYATKPDTYGRSTYTFRTEYEHKPHGLLFYRTSDQLLLNALYSVETIDIIKTELIARGGSDGTFFANRYLNLLDFDALLTNGDFLTFPATNGYKFPYPDKVGFFDWCNEIINRINESSNQPPIPNIPESAYGTLPAGHDTIRDFVKGALLSAFIPLTKAPIIYEYINDDSYKPNSRPQNLRDSNGNILSPFHPDFVMAPMMKIVNTSPHQTQFTDFKLDGTTNNVYFYAVRELGTSMAVSEMSPALGPVLLPNTNPPERPEIKSLIPSLDNPQLGLSAKMQIDINAFDEIQNITKIKVYRSKTLLDAQSIRTMKEVKEVDITSSNFAGSPVWSIADTFDDLSEIPYGDPLYYRAVVLREVKYERIDIDNGLQKNLVTDYQASQPSKILGGLMVQNAVPESPVMKYYSEPIDSYGDILNITLAWNKTTYKGIYHVYKMTQQGNWSKIGEQRGNEEEELFLDLIQTQINDSGISTLDNNGNPIYHHFKVIAENSSGLLSTQENIMTIPNLDNWVELGGIGDMIIDGTFTIGNINHLEVETRNALRIAYENNFQAPDNNTITSLNRLIRRMKQEGLWDKKDTFFNFAYNNLLLSDFAKIDLKRSILCEAPYGVEPVLTEYGFDFDLQAALDTNFVPSTDGENYTQDDASKECIIYDLSGGTACINTALNSTDERWFSAGPNSWLNSASPMVGTLPSNVVGYRSISRSNSSEVNYVTKYTTKTLEQIADRMSNRKIVIGNYATSSSYDHAFLSMFAMGSSLSFQETQKQREILNEFFANIGLNEIA